MGFAVRKTLACTHYAVRMPETWWEYVTRISDGAPQKEIAGRGGFDPSRISGWKHGDAPSVHNAVAVARAYGRPAVEGIVAAGFIGPDEATDAIELKPSVTELSDEQLIDEIRRRMKGEHHGVADDAQPNAQSEARETQEVRLSDDRQDRSGGIDRDVGGRKHTRVDRAEDREKRNYLPG